LSITLTAIVTVPVKAALYVYVEPVPTVNPFTLQEYEYGEVPFAILTPNVLLVPIHILVKFPVISTRYVEQGFGADHDI